MIFTLPETLVFLLAAHFLFDYALQGDWMSKAKNPKLDLVPGEEIWPLALFGHSLLHATAVYVITGSWFLFVVELVVHFVTDYEKCNGRFGYNADQINHVLWKVLYVIFLWIGVAFVT